MLIFEMFAGNGNPQSFDCALSSSHCGIVTYYFSECTYTLGYILEDHLYRLFHILAALAYVISAGVDH